MNLWLKNTTKWKHLVVCSLPVTLLICSFLQNSEKLLHVQNIYYHFSALLFHHLWDIVRQDWTYGNVGQVELALVLHWGGCAHLALVVFEPCIVNVGNVGAGEWGHHKKLYDFQCRSWMKQNTFYHCADNVPTTVLHATVLAKWCQLCTYVHVK